MSELLQRRGARARVFAHSAARAWAAFPRSRLRLRKPHRRGRGWSQHLRAFASQSASSANPTRPGDSVGSRQPATAHSSGRSWYHLPIRRPATGWTECSPARHVTRRRAPFRGRSPSNNGEARPCADRSARSTCVPGAPLRPARVSSRQRALPGTGRAEPRTGRDGRTGRPLCVSRQNTHWPAGARPRARATLAPRPLRGKSSISASMSRSSR
jgi:hypothetical protein